jgi:hypothetical protein
MCFDKWEYKDKYLDLYRRFKALRRSCPDGLSFEQQEDWWGQKVREFDKNILSE